MIFLSYCQKLQNLENCDDINTHLALHKNWKPLNDSASWRRSLLSSLEDKRKMADHVGIQEGGLARRCAPTSNLLLVLFSSLRSHPHAERTDSFPKKKKISHSCNTYCKGPQTKHPTCGYITTGSPTADIMIYKYPENDAKLFSMFLYKERPSDYLHHFNSF